jgi:pantoate--beta-alanine ligase
VRKAREISDFVVVSIFVNPIQFGPSEDLSRYPRDFDRDRDLCDKAGAHVIFCPAADEMYPPGHSTYVEETVLSKGLCGASRPGHFRGVATVVAKLFNIVQPDIAVFGQKDAQQARVIEQMVSDLDFRIRLIIAPIVREPDGLAMSSRNTYLSPDDRRDAVCIYKALLLARNLCGQGVVRTDAIKDRMKAVIGEAGSAKIEYIETVDHRTLEPVDVIKGTTLIAVAVKIGRTRLIDNIIVGPA